jgi:hypothetical protein
VEEPGNATFMLYPDKQIRRCLLPQSSRQSTENKLPSTWIWQALPKRQRHDNHRHVKLSNSASASNLMLAFVLVAASVTGLVGVMPAVIGVANRN